MKKKHPTKQAADLEVERCQIDILWLQNRIETIKSLQAKGQYGQIAKLIKELE